MKAVVTNALDNYEDDDDNEDPWDFDFEAKK
jgi:hypothetical protein